MQEIEKLEIKRTNLKKLTVIEQIELMKLIYQTQKKTNKKEKYGIEVANSMLLFASIENVEKRFKDLEIFVLKNEEEILGTLSYLEEGNQYELKSFYIKYDKLKKGYGSKLIIYVLNHLKEKGVKKVKVSILPSSLKFYKKSGFKIIKEYFSKTTINDFTYKTFLLEKEL